MSKPDFTLWLEFEHWQKSEDEQPENDFFNMQIQLSSGKSYALNVWTYNFLDTAREEHRKTGEELGGRYLIAPDLFVEKLDRELMEEVVSDMIANRSLKDEWLIKPDEVTSDELKGPS